MGMIKRETHIENEYYVFLFLIFSLLNKKLISNSILNILFHANNENTSKSEKSEFYN